MCEPVKTAEVLAAHLKSLPDDERGREALQAFVAALDDALGRSTLEVVGLGGSNGTSRPERAQPDDRLQALVRIGNELSRALTVDDLFHNAVRLARGHLGFDRVGVWLVDEEDPDTIVGTFGIDDTGGIRDERGVRLRIPEDGVINRMRRSVSDPEHPEECLLRDGRGIVIGTGPQCAGALWDGEIVRGCVFADNLFSQRAVDRHDAEILSLFASILSHLYARARGEAERNRLAAAVDHAAEGIVIIDDALEAIIYANPAVCTITGHAPADLLGQDPGAFVAPEGSELHLRIRDVLVEAGLWTGRIELRRRDDTTCITDTTLSAVRNPWGAPIAYVAIIRDMSDYLALEEQLVEARKMQAVGALAAGVAHDFNNLLTAILGAASMVRLSTREGDPTLRAAELIERAARKAGQLTQQLLGFARQGKLREVPVDMHALIEDTVGRIRGTIGQGAQVELDLAAAIHGVWGDPDQLQQVLLGLLTNAIEASPTGGIVRIRTAVGPRRDGPIELADGAISAHELVVSVVDAGTGIPAHIRPRIFEPFFTTKPQGRRTGLGLAMIEGVIEAHSGSIGIESTEGAGTTVTVRLPLAGGIGAAEIPPDAPRGCGSILLVDDEESCRRAGAGILRSLGYSVRAVASGEDALAAYQDADPPFDLVVVDLVMPSAGGADCCRALRRLDPAARLVVSSQHGADLAHRTVDEWALGVVGKPFEPVELARAVWRAIGGRRAPTE